MDRKNPPITVRQAAILKNKNPSTIRMWCAKGWITAQRIGRDWMIDKESLMQFNTKLGRKTLAASPSQAIRRLIQERKSK